MVGGTGDDIYFVDDAGDKVVEQAGADSGIDIVASLVSYVLSANVENLNLNSNGDIDGTGNSLDNVIFGLDGANKILGLDGNDILLGDSGNDTLDGGNGNDTLDAGFFGGNDLLIGGAGDDVLSDGGSADGDIMAGGTGNDRYVVGVAGDQVIEAAGQGTDTIQTDLRDFTLDTKALANVENLIFRDGAFVNTSWTGNSLNNLISSGSGNDTLNGGLGNDTLDGRSGANLLLGGKGNDVYVVSFAGDSVFENGNEGIDTVQSNLVNTDLRIMGDVENLILLGKAGDGIGNGLANAITGNDGNNVLSGLDGNDTLSGGAGNDTLAGGLGTNLMAGGTGSETYFVDDSGDKIVELAGADSGIDQVVASVSYALSANIEVLLLTGDGDIDGTGNAENNTIDGTNGANKIFGLAGKDLVFGKSGNDTLDGGSDNDRLVGDAGDDKLLGGAGDDILEGGDGTDTMAGGTGNDQYAVIDAGDQVIEAAGQGVDTIFTTLANFTLDTKALANVENLALSGGNNSTGTGNSLNNEIRGNLGNNTLNGGLGNDTLDGFGGTANLLQGGKGDDVYVVRVAGDSVFENANEGIDTVLSNLAGTDLQTMGEVENLILLGNGNTSGIGNGLANAITGNEGRNSLFGLGGNDTLNGGAGNDTLDGGSGKDLMAGGTGNDIYFVDDAGDRIVELAGADSKFDTVEASVSYVLSANIESLFLAGDSNLNGTGNTLDNSITGNDGANKLFGLAGDDNLSGESGNDTLDGGSGNDDIFGGVGDNSLIGGAGNDTLIGGTGADTIAGGTGDDRYLQIDANDQVIEAVGQGIDTIVTDLTNFTLDTKALANVENLVLRSSNSVGTGNSLNNSINGSVGNDTLNGGLGNDTLNGQGGASNELHGGKGNDTYVIILAGDSVFENANEGIDTVQSNLVTTDLGTLGDVENLILLDNAFNGKGNDLANVITGNENGNLLQGRGGNDTLSCGAGDDVLDGGDGKDLMAGGAGNDAYGVGDSGDKIVELAGADSGIDTVFASVSYALSANIEGLFLDGAGDINGTGNAQNNNIQGNGGANKLFGLAGNDFIVGDAGNDTLDGGSGNDIVKGGSGADIMTGGDGNDTLDGESGADKMAGGAGNDTLIGGIGADVMTGGAGRDVFAINNIDDDAEIVTDFAAGKQGDHWIFRICSPALSPVPPTPTTSCGSLVTAPAARWCRSTSTAPPTAPTSSMSACCRTRR